MLKNRGIFLSTMLLVFCLNLCGIEPDICYKKPGEPLKILVALGCFPLLAETFINLQIMGLMKDHDVTIHSAHPGQKKMHPDVIKHKLLDYTYYGDLPPDMAEYDIILCQFGPIGKKFLKLKKQLGFKAKIVTCMRGYDITQEVKQKGRHVYDVLFEEGDFFLPVCEYFKDIMIDLGCDPKKIKVHHSAINTERFAFRTIKKGNPLTKNKKICIASVQRLVPKKGIIYAIQAVTSLLNKYPHIEYNIMGDGSLKRRLMHMVNRNKASRSIKFLGWGTHDEVAALLKTADIFILPSITDTKGNQEGIPNALKEAMAVGIPVIATFHAGNAELIENGKTGFLVPSGNSKEIAKKIEYLIEHPEKRIEMGMLTRAHIEAEYDNDTLNNQLIALFYELLSEKKGK